MRIAMMSLVTALTAISAGASAQGIAGGTMPAGQAATVTGSDRMPSSGPGQRSDKSPGGVISGTNPNPDAGRAGGIRSPGAAVNRLDGTAGR